MSTNTETITRPRAMTGSGGHHWLWLSLLLLLADQAGKYTASISITYGDSLRVTSFFS